MCTRPESVLRNAAQLAGLSIDHIVLCHAPAFRPDANNLFESHSKVFLFCSPVSIQVWQVAFEQTDRAFETGV